MPAQHWPPRTAANAAGMKPKAFMRRFETGVLKLRGSDRKSTGSGCHVGLSRQRIYQAAIVEQLSRIGVSVSLASASAFHFSDAGNIGRNPGQLYEHGKTLLVINDEGATVKNVLFSDSIADASNDCACAITVNINKVVEQVDAVLNNERNS
jgi:hypothetical protein